MTDHVMKGRLPERLTPLAAGLGYRPFYGDVHNHCALSYGHGTLEVALERARRQLDFVSVTGHAHWPDMPVDDPRVAHIVDFHVRGFARLAAAWPGHFATLAAAAEQGRFTVFPGYEIHSCAHGDYTILYRDLVPAPVLKADSPAELKARLAGEHPGPALAFPHHIGYRLGARGINWASFDEALSPVVEIVSMHGSSEDSLTDRPFLHSMGPSDGGGTVRHGLAAGHRFGFAGNTDHHSGYPGSYGHGRTCLYAPENAAGALWDALRARRSTALTGDCCHLFVVAEGRPQGSVVPPGTSEFEIEAVGGSAIDCIDVLRNGRLAARVSPELTPAPIDAPAGDLETVLVVEFGWGARGSHHDWDGTIELVGGEILAVEPRLRGAEIVSPLEGAADAPDETDIACDGDVIAFRLRAHANPNNATATTQAIAARVRVGEGARVRAWFDGNVVEVPVARLFDGAVSGNLGPIDSPAYRFHPLPRPEAWQWRGRLAIEPLGPGETVYVRMRQANGQRAWASPLFCGPDGS